MRGEGEGREQDNATVMRLDDSESRRWKEAGGRKSCTSVVLGKCRLYFVIGQNMSHEPGQSSRPTPFLPPSSPQTKSTRSWTCRGRVRFLTKRS